MKTVIPANPFTVVGHLIVPLNDDKIIMLQRTHTGILDGFWCLPSGTIEPGESPRDMMVREADEEVGLKLHQVTLAAIIAHRTTSVVDPACYFQAIELFFVASLWAGTPRNGEPHKHGHMMHADPDNLPTPVTPVVAEGIRMWRTGQTYQELWLA